MATLRVFSLNCWGVRYISKWCDQRYQMVAELLTRQKHDIVLLQEVWCEKDFKYLKQSLAATHPHCHYFSSGVVGAGLAVFSQHRILEAFLYRYSLNGFPYMAHHGDWFAGKAVGMVVCRVNGLTVHLYITHLHAEYCREQDVYLPHRLLQVWELQSFIRHTGSGADLLILAGDLNMHPDDLGTRLLQACTGLRDCYVETQAFDGCEGGETLLAENPFTNKKELSGKGVRIDYIFFKGSAGLGVSCKSMSTTQGSVAGKPFPYSDHEALSAELLLEPVSAHVVSDACDRAERLGELVTMVMEARTELKVGLHCAERRQRAATRTGLMGVALLLLEIGVAAVPWLVPQEPQPFPHTTYCLLGALCLLVLTFSLLLYLLHKTQVRALQAGEQELRLAAGQLQVILRGGRDAECGRAHGPYYHD